MESKKVVIFGIQDFAELAWYYLTKDSPYEVVGFAVHEQFIDGNTSFHGLPVVPFETVVSVYPPSTYSFFAPMSPKKMNKLRADIYTQIKSLGYTLISYISSKATICDNVIGENCFILEDNTLQPFTNIGNNVVLWSGNHIGHHGEIRDHVTFTSHVVLSGHCIVEPYSFFGVNATIRDGITIAEGTLVGMGAVITKNTKAWSAYLGTPAVLLEGKNSTNLL